MDDLPGAPRGSIERPEYPRRVRNRHSGRRVGGDGDVFPHLEIDTRHLAWQAQAVCTSIDPESFFPEGAVGEAVLNVCRGCPVIAVCLEYALAHPELGGIWAATSALQRSHIRRRRQRAS